jgi:hypothetical protein
MSKNKTFYIAILVICFVILLVIEYMTPKPINWQRTYSKDDKIPFGTYVLFDLLPELFSLASIKENYETMYELSLKLEDKNDYNEVSEYQRNFILLNEDFSPEKEETDAILEMAANGSTFFIASNHFGGLFADTLGIKTSDYNIWELDYNENAKKVPIKLTNSRLSKRNFLFYEHIVPFTFEELVPKPFIDLKTVRVLGKNGKKPNFIYIPHGLGAFYLHTSPLIFTNHSILTDQNNEYIATAFSYLPQRDIVWDEYYKVGRKTSQNELRFVLQHLSLRYAWFLFLATILLFIFFKAKRTQRIIPIMRLPQNTTLGFTKIIGQLYYQRRDDTDLAKKKITYFLAYIRTTFYVQTNELDKEFIENLANKSGYDMAKLKRIFGLIADVQNYNFIAENQLLELSHKIDEFYEFGKVK